MEVLVNTRYKDYAHEDGYMKNDLKLLMKHNGSQVETFRIAMGSTSKFS